MSERFDTLFSGLSEESALKILATPPESLDNPGLKYLAASRLGACDSDLSLQCLVDIVETKPNNLYDRIARRKAVDALGRRKRAESIPTLINALNDDDEPTVVNIADALSRIGNPLTDSQRLCLIDALQGPGNQKRAIIQACTRPVSYTHLTLPTKA